MMDEFQSVKVILNHLVSNFQKFRTTTPVTEITTCKEHMFVVCLKSSLISNFGVAGGKFDVSVYLTPR